MPRARDHRQTSTAPIAERVAPCRNGGSAGSVAFTTTCCSPHSTQHASIRPDRERVELRAPRGHDVDSPASRIAAPTAGRAATRSTYARRFGQRVVSTFRKRAQRSIVNR